MKFSFKLICLILFLFSLFSFPQNNPDFEKALKLYDGKKYYEALALFENIIKSPVNSRTTASYIFKGKILLALDKIGEAKSSTLDFLNNYPSSRYVSEARLLLAKIYLGEKDYIKSFNQLLIILNDSDSLVYLNQAAADAENLALTYLNETQVKSLYKSFNNEKIKSFLLLITAKLQLSKKEFEDARAVLNEITKLYPDSKFRSEAESLISQISEGAVITKSNETNICAMLPLKGIIK